MEETISSEFKLSESYEENFRQRLAQIHDRAPSTFSLTLNLGYNFGSTQNAIEDRPNSAGQKLEEVKRRENRLDLVQKFVEEKFREIEAREKELELMSESIDRKLKLLEEKEKRLELLRNSIDEKANQIREMKREISQLLEEMEVKEKQSGGIFDELKLKEKEIEERSRLVAFNYENFSGSHLELEEERNKLGVKAEKFEHLEFKVKQIQAKNEEVELEEKHPMSAEDNQGKEDLSQLINMLEDHQLQDGEIFDALQSATDPGKLVLGVMNVSFPFKVGKKDFKSCIPRKSCIFLLQQLSKLTPQINGGVKELAKEYALQWKKVLAKNTKDPLEVICFLQFLAAFKLASIFSADELLSLLDTDHWSKEAPDLLQVLGLADKIPNFIENHIRRSRHLEAVKYIYALDIVDEFPPVPILEDHLSNSSKRKSKATGGQIGEIVKDIKSLKAVIKCIADYKITSLSPENLKERIVELKKQKRELYRIQASEINTISSSPSISNLDQQVPPASAPTSVSTPNTELQQPDMHDKEDFLINMLGDHQLQSGEIADALRDATDSGKLVLDVMNNSFPLKPEGNKDFKLCIPRKSCVFLLEQFRKLTPQINAGIKELAKEYALHWKRILAKNREDPLEVICFLQFLAAFKLASIFSADELLSLLDTDHWCKEAPDLCQVLSLSDKIPSFIEDHIKRSQHLEAVKYIYALDIVDKFPPVPILEDHLSNSSKRKSKATGGQMGEIIKDIKSVRAVIKCIEDYKIPGLSPENLKLRVAQLQKQRKELHRTQALEIKTRSNSNLDQQVSLASTELQQQILVSSEDSRASGTSPNHKLQRRQVRWAAPEPGWIKLNSDGSLKRKAMRATAGGILRDSNGDWLGGFAHNMEFSTVFEAELWGAFDGLSLAWDLGFKKVILEMDSRTVLKHLLEEDEEDDSMISATKSLLCRDWEVRLCHIYRNGNQCADWLADYAINLPLGLHILDPVPEGILQFLQTDVLGASLPLDSPL